ncbi:zinc ribbon domain-containing protein [Paraburkholderia phymatum]|uniref:Regulatory protein, FmdB family n=1 Tax=Paraburkholderia phymatum (strain DSM 17167 / CIP 108236 / LMG 21445 / STM815) TaxID=391038 RepID=B2JR49_PARP8|nr:zinc ribbon domain-containing protein [Paraburkholderia phymatum]ACC72275.1 regulatory protein, FmdB family [Paraburkholderia phymatum STM815]
MPVYDYTCADCGAFEAVRRIAERDEPAACPRCGTLAQRVRIGAPALLGGASGDASGGEGGYGMRHRGCSCCP